MLNGLALDYVHNEIPVEPLEVLHWAKDASSKQLRYLDQKILK